MRPAILLLLVLGLGLPSVAAYGPETANGAAASGPRLLPTSEYVWRDGWKDFGGWSGLSLDADGTRFTAISDGGSWTAGMLKRENGRIVGAERQSSGHLHGIDGARLKADDVDAEGLAVDREGRAYVSFEGFHRIRRYDDLRGPATAIPSHPDFARLQNNSGLEAIAFDAAGTLYAIPERSGAWTRPYPVYRFSGGHWDKSLRLRRDGTFLVSDAAFGPDGRLYLLERDFTWLGGFSTRVRRFSLGPTGFGDEVTLLQTGVGDLDNMEGISVWRDSTGDIRVTLLSDDNFFPLEKTMFAEYRLVGE